MESLDQDFQSNTANQLNVTRTMREDWLSTSKWAFFISIVVFIFIGLGFIIALSLTQVINMMQSMSGVDNPVLSIMGSMGSALTVFYILVLGLQLVINYFQYRFAQQLKRAVQLTDQDAHEQAWLNFRNFCRINGIMLIVMLVLYIILLGSMGAILSSTLSN